MEEQPLTQTSNQVASGEGETKQLVGFGIGEDRFALDIMMVQEIISKPEITTLPNAPDFIEGVINLRGDIIPVIELRKRYSIPASLDGAGATRIIIVDINGRITGFLVDSVSKVFKVDKNLIKPPPDIVTAGLESQYIKGVCEVGDNLITLLDFRKILGADEIDHLQSVNLAAV